MDRDRSNWFYNHPKIKELEDNGINDMNVIITALAVYIHLIEVCHLFNVEMHPSQRLMKVLISGYKSRQKTDREVFLPMRGNSPFLPKSISELMEDSFFLSLSDKPSINIAVVSGDSNILFYKISDGLPPPEFAE